jgi:chemotaxis protein MotB
MADDQRPRIIVKKKGGHAAHHGGAWKVAYADFVTAMMALFMVLWLLTQADLKLRQQIAQYFRSPGVLQGGSVVAPEMNEAKSREPKVVQLDVTIVQGDAEEDFLRGKEKEIEETIQQAAAADPALDAIKDQVIVTVTDQGLSIQVVDKGKTLLFDVSSADLKPSVVAMLERIAGVLGKMPNPIQLGGHTDSRPYPAQATMTNWELSFRRADAARRVLEAHGLRPGQVNRVLAYADTEPLVPNDPMADENRRLSILAVRMSPPPGPQKATTGGAPAGDAPIVLPPDPLPSPKA